MWQRMLIWYNGVPRRFSGFVVNYLNSRIDGLRAEVRSHGLHVLLTSLIKFLYLWGRLEEKFEVAELWDRDELINGTKAAAADVKNLCGQLVTDRSSIRRRFVRGVVRRSGDAWNICCDVHSVRSKVPTSRTDCTQRRSLWNDD